MNIRSFYKLIQTFVKGSRNMPYKSAMEGILLGDKPYSLKEQPGYNEVDFLAENIKNSVLSYIRNKDVANMMVMAEQVSLFYVKQMWNVTYIEHTE